MTMEIKSWNNKDIWRQYAIVLKLSTETSFYNSTSYIVKFSYVGLHLKVGR